MSKFGRFNTRAAVLTPEQVLEIRERYSQGETQGSLCRAFSVSIGTIGRIVRGETWNQHAGPRAEQTLNLPPTSQEQIDASFQRLQEQLGQVPDPNRPSRGDPTEERSAEVLEKLEKLAEKNPEIQADKALDSLLDPEGAKKFLE